MSRGRRLGLTTGVGRRGDARCVGWCGDNGAKPASGGERRRVGLRGVRVGGPWGVQHVTSLKIEFMSLYVLYVLSVCTPIGDGSVARHVVLCSTQVRDVSMGHVMTFPDLFPLSQYSTGQ